MSFVRKIGGFAILFIFLILAVLDCTGSGAAYIPAQNEVVWQQPCAYEVGITAVPPPQNVVCYEVITPTATATPTITPTATLTPTGTPSATPTITPTATPTMTGGFVVDHTNLYLFDSIPAQYQAAGAALTFTFYDRSVGSNINDGLACLSYPSWSDSPSHCRRDWVDQTQTSWKTFNTNDPVIPALIQFDGGMDRSNWTFVFIGGSWEDDVNTFITAVHADQPDAAGLMLNYLQVQDGTGIDTNFFDPTYSPNVYDLEALEAQYPQTTFIYFTSSLARTIGTETAENFNNQLRQWATDNDKLLVDIAYIESHDRDGNLCAIGGFAVICRDYTTEANGGHLGAVSGGKLRIARALWIMMAYIAGWDGGS